MTPILTKRLEAREVPSRTPRQASKNPGAGMRPCGYSNPCRQQAFCSKPCCTTPRKKKTVATVDRSLSPQTVKLVRAAATRESGCAQRRSQRGRCTRSSRAAPRPPAGSAPHRSGGVTEKMSGIETDTKSNGFEYDSVGFEQVAPFC